MRILHPAHPTFIPSTQTSHPPSRKISFTLSTASPSRRKPPSSPNLSPCSASISHHCRQMIHLLEIRVMMSESVPGENITISMSNTMASGLSAGMSAGLRIRRMLMQHTSGHLRRFISRRRTHRPLLPRDCRRGMRHTTHVRFPRLACNVLRLMVSPE